MPLMMHLGKILLTLALLLGLFAGSGRAETLTLPITLDYAFIQAALKQQVFRYPGSRAVVLDQGCNKIALWNPRVSRAGDHLRLLCSLKVDTGVEVLDSCVGASGWQGLLDVRQRVWLEPKSLRIRVQTQSSRLLEPDGRPAKGQNMLYSLVRDYVHRYLDNFVVRLQQPMQDLQKNIPLFFEPGMRKQAYAWLRTLRSGGVRVMDHALRLSLVIDVKKTRRNKRPSGPELSPAERKELMRCWELWDAFLVYKLSTLAGHSLSRPERDLALKVLLDNRRAMDRARNQPNPSRDLVLKQFMESWRRLSPVLRRHLWSGAHPDAMFRLFAFMTAADVLTALGRRGPDLGLDISERGLKHLARLLGHQTGDLRYAPGYNPALRRLFGLKSAPRPRPKPKKTGPG